MREPVVRRATPQDARGIAEVHVASWTAAYTGIIPETKMAQLDLDERERRWRQILGRGDASDLRGWVAMLSDELVGFAITQPSMDEDADEDVHELSALYLVPRVWRRGIGSRLLMAAERELQQANVRDATLWVLEANGAATRFYEAHSWRLDTRDPSFRDFEVPAVRYRKSL